MTCRLLAGPRLTVNVNAVEPLSPSATLGESMASVAWALMVTSTVSVAMASPAVTVSVNVSVTSSVTFGAVKLGVAVSASVRLAVGLPPVWRQE